LTPPEFWIIAGVNGAGKSTLVSDKDIRSVIGQFPFLNPDLPVSCLRASLPGISLIEANYAAVVAVEAIVERRIADDKSVGVETVLSSSKFMRHVDEARRRGFFLGMIYVGLPSVELAIRRVADRHALGGHDVPENRIRDRWTRSHDNLGRFAAMVDLLLVYSNADPTGRPVLVARKTDVGMDLLRPGLLPEVDRRLSGLKPAAR
jgi:predicted ABC-type ATPase